jgi:hypothetical protein
VAREGLTRRRLLARAGAGAALATFAGVVPPARAGVPDGDLAYARLLVAVELLSLDFYGRAIRARRFEPMLDLRRARAAEKQHYEAVAAILMDAGQVPATAQDIDFSYPRGAFASSASIARLGVQLETLALGAHLGAVRALQTPLYRDHAARAAASEAQHLSVFSAAIGGRRLGPGLPAALAMQTVSDTLSRYTG